MSWKLGKNLMTDEEKLRVIKERCYSGQDAFTKIVEIKEILNGQ